MAGRLAIPFIGPKGNVYDIRFRALDDSDPKYLGLAGVETRLFNVRALAEADDVVAVTEGEIDAISLTEAGIPAVGVVGVNHWKPWHKRLFEGFDRVLVVGDSDEPGRDFTRKVCSDVLSATPITLPSGVKDINELLVRDGAQGVRLALRMESE